VSAGVYEGTEWLHVVTGMASDAWRRAMIAGQSLPASEHPTMHRHPILDGLTHSHGGGDRLHGHHPVVDWGPPIFLHEGGV
jgi:hypothetical protein